MPVTAANVRFVTDEEGDDVAFLDPRRSNVDRALFMV